MSKLITYHPTFAFFHEPYSKGAFLKDIEHFARMIRKEPYEPMKLIANATLKDVKALCESSNVLALDIETAPETPEEPWTGKDPTRAKLRSIGIGTTTRGVSFLWENCSPQLFSYVQTVLRSRRWLKVLHNGPWFDVRVLKRYKLAVVRWSDTRDMRRAQSSTSRLKLGFLASIYDYTNDWKHQEEDEDDDKIVFTKDLNKLQVYNAQDTVETARVYRGLKREPWDDRAKRLLDTHYKLSTIAAKMHSNGIYVHQRNRAFYIHCLEQAIEEKAARVKALVNVDGFECTDDHLRAILFKRHEWTKRIGGKKTGKDFRIAKFGLDDPLNPKMYTDDTLETISVAEPALLMLLAGGELPPTCLPILDAWWDLQGDKKRRGYVASEMFTQAMGRDGRLRPGWNSCGTDTMRFSCSSPNVMNIEQVLREILAPAPGKVIVHADKSQLELRVMEVVANDRALKQALDSGDVYSFDARKWFGLPDDMDVKKLKPAARKASKIIHLGSQYAAGVAAIYAQALKQDRSFKFSAARMLNTQFKQTYSDTVSYWSEEMSRVMAQGYSEGRILRGRRTYPAPPELSEVVNYPIQRTAGEMMNLELIELDERLTKEVPSAKLIIQLHDAVDVECNPRDEEKVGALLDDVFDSEWTIEGRTRRFPIERKTAYALGTNPDVPWWDGTWADV